MATCPNCSESNTRNARFCRECGIVFAKTSSMDDRNIEALGHFFSLLESQEKAVQRPQKHDRLEQLAKLSKFSLGQKSGLHPHIEKTFDMHAFELEELKKTVLAHEIERRMETSQLEEKIRQLESRLAAMEKGTGTASRQRNF